MAFETLGEDKKERNAAIGVVVTLLLVLGCFIVFNQPTAQSNHPQSLLDQAFQTATLNGRALVVH